MHTTSGEPHNVVDVATRVAAKQELRDVTRENERPLPPLPKSLSSPLFLPWSASSTPILTRRTKSELGLGDMLKVPKQRAVAKSKNDSSEGVDGVSGQQLHPSWTTSIPAFNVKEPTAERADGTMQRSDFEDHHNGPDAAAKEAHLHTMDISHQLRSISQLSDPMEDDVSLMSGNPWNFHLRERSGIGFESSGRSRHSRIKSSTGVDSTTVPSAGGRVRSPTAASSSIYSRPTSAGPNAEDASAVQSNRPPYTIPMDMNALFADWPLRPAASSDRSSTQQVQRDKPLPPAHFDGHKDSRPKSGAISKARDSLELTWLSLPGDTSAVPRTSSSSVISGSSKTSRFLEHFSPPRRLVRKRRSIFKFLRPGSRKQQARSISTPAFSTASPSAACDGPADDPALLTVQYELVEQPQHATRSASMGQLGPERQSTSVGQLSSPSLERQPTLADYERRLSVMGDDRRRPSSMNLQRLNEIQEEDRKESLGIRRKLSRAKELKDDVSPLMAQALTKHQQEKDMFRSNSKRRDAAERAQRPTPVFAQSTFGTTGSSLAATPEEQSELLDPLEKRELAKPAGRENSFSLLSPLNVPGPSRRGSSIAAPSISSGLRSSPTQVVTAPTAVPRQPRIGTSLASWSRYPSHTRFERCGTASKADNVIARDFAFTFDPAGVHASDESDAGSTGPHPGVKVLPKQAKRLQKSRSLTFGSIMRYYSNLFHTSGWAGQNRRTSVTLGGKLEHPELEMVSPSVPIESQHGYDTLKHLKDIVKEDAEMIKDFVEDEEAKIGDYVHKEEVKLQSFMREEEDKIEKLVEEEEGRIEGFVKKEEGSFMKFLHEEEGKFKHHQEQRHSEHSKTPFRHSSIFNEDTHRHLEHNNTGLGPVDDKNEEAPESPTGLHLDGTANTKPGLPASQSSKAQLWSDIYQQCIIQPPSKEPLPSESMPPPAALPKPRIRRFPSVTVIDDKQGHYRSISLISVKTGRS